MKYLLSIVFIILSAITPTICVVRSIQFTQECEGYLKQAADANTPDLAVQRHDKAIEYVRENNLTSGYTSMFYKTEDENIEFWYNNMIACRDELLNCKSSTQLEQTNVLIKVRESLLDEGSSRGSIAYTDVTLPRGISRYPHNLLFLILNCISFILLFIGFLSLVPVKDA